MAEATDYARVVYRGTSVNVDFDGKIRTFSDIAKVAAIEHLGMTLVDARVPAGALSLRGPLVAASKDLALAELKPMGGVELSDEIDRARVPLGAWFLLEIGFVDAASTLAALRSGAARK